MWKIDTAKMWSLGLFKPELPRNPTPLASWNVQLLMEEWLKRRVNTNGLQLRSPNHHWSVKNHIMNRERDNDGEDVRDWHQDGTENGERYLGLWSNSIATDVRVKHSRQDTVYRALPGEFILIHNKFFVHREPPEISLAEAKSRWFARFSADGWVKPHRSVKVCEL